MGSVYSKGVAKFMSVCWTGTDLNQSIVRVLSSQRLCGPTHAHNSSQLIKLQKRRFNLLAAIANLPTSLSQFVTFSLACKAVGILLSEIFSWFRISLRRLASPPARTMGVTYAQEFADV